MSRFQLILAKSSKPSSCSLPLLAEVPDRHDNQWITQEVVHAKTASIVCQTHELSFDWLWMSVRSVWEHTSQDELSEFPGPFARFLALFETRHKLLLNETMSFWDLLNLL